MKIKNTFTAIVISFVLFWDGCVDLPTDVILPEWDVNINLPIINKEYTLNDVIKSTEFASIQPSPTDNIYIIQTDTYEGSTEIADNISVSNGTELLDIPVFASDTDSVAIYLDLPAGVSIDSAKFISGNISFKIENPTDESVNISLSVPGIIDRSGNSLVINASVGPKGSDSVNYSLQSHRYVLPKNQPAENQNSLQIVTSASSSGPFGTFVYVDFYSSDFKFESLFGKMPKTFLGTKEIPVKLDFGEILRFRDRLFMKEARFTLNTKYLSYFGNPFTMGLHDVKIVGKRNDGKIKALEYRSESKLNIDLLSNETALIFSEVNSNINEFLTFFPDSIFISADFYLNPYDDLNTRSASILDSVHIDSDFRTKASFAMKATTISDTTEINLSAADRDKMKNGNSLDLTIEVDNALPFTTFLTITLTDENYNPLHVLTKTVSGTDSVEFRGGDIDLNSGNVINPVTSKVNIKLNKEEIEKLTRAHYALVSTTVRTRNAFENVPNPPLVNIRSTDWIKIRCYGSSNYRIDPGDGL